MDYYPGLSHTHLDYGLLLWLIPRPLVTDHYGAEASLAAFGALGESAYIVSMAALLSVGALRGFFAAADDDAGMPSPTSCCFSSA